MIKLVGKRKWLVLLIFTFLIISFSTYLVGTEWYCLGDLGCWGGDSCQSDFFPEEMHVCMFACYVGINKTYLFCEEPPRK